MKIKVQMIFRRNLNASRLPHRSANHGPFRGTALPWKLRSYDMARHGHQTETFQDGEVNE